MQSSSPHPRGLSMIFKAIKRLINWVRPGTIMSPPSTKEAWERMYQMCDDYNDLCFYISQIKGLDPTPDLLKYIERADYGLLSTRDELKILLDRDQRHERIKKRLSGDTASTGPNPGRDGIR